MKLRPSGGSQRRFVSWKPEPGRSTALEADHPAVVDGRTYFPSRLADFADSPRYLVSGKNNPKTGAKVVKGPWKGMPIYTLTLEERATCPRSCAQWAGCYGNAMHWPLRHDASHPDFIPALAAEVVTVSRQHPGGFVVRLHVLGDFFSGPYVMAWARLLDMLPNLHVYGYTARRADLDDAESRRIARALAVLTDHLWDRFAIRTSHTEAGSGRSIVVDQDPGDPDVIVCPAQTEATDSCGTCGLCWSPAARGKTIAFLRHGIKVKRGIPRPRQPAEAAPRPTADPDFLAAARARLAPFDKTLRRTTPMRKPK